MVGTRYKRVPIAASGGAPRGSVRREPRHGREAFAGASAGNARGVHRALTIRRQCGGVSHADRTHPIYQCVRRCDNFRHAPGAAAKGDLPAMTSSKSRPKTKSSNPALASQSRSARRDLRLQRRVDLPSRLGHVPLRRKPCGADFPPTKPMVPFSGAVSVLAIRSGFGIAKFAVSSYRLQEFEPGAAWVGAFVSRLDKKAVISEGWLA